MFIDSAETDEEGKDTSIIDIQSIVSDDKDDKEVESDHKFV